MTVRRKVALTAAFGAAPLLLTVLTAPQAAAHGSMESPVSRIAACFAEGPESPDSAACKALVAAGGTQPLYDWNEVNIADAAGRHRQIIPDGKLCSAGREKYRGLDAPRTDWPATQVSAGEFTFRYRATAPHRGGFELYITKDGYDPSKPLKWSDLEPKPFATVQDPTLTNGSYVFRATIPKKSGRHLIYSIWQRTDSPEAFYACSDVVFSGSSGSTGKEGSTPETKSGTVQDTKEPGAPAAAPAVQPSAPTDQQIAAGAKKSTVSHGGHGGDTPEEKAAAASGKAPAQAAPDHRPAGDARPAGDGQLNLAETGGDSSTLPLAVGGAAIVALGVVTLTAARRRSASRRGA